MNQHFERLDGLATFVRPVAFELLARCEATLRRTLMVVHGARSMQEQALLYQIGRAMNRETGEWEVTDADVVVTNSKPGQTAHNVITRDGHTASVALDVIPLNDDGTADWDVDRRFWDRLYEISWKVGLDPLGDQIGSYLKRDLGHFEEPAWRLKLQGFGLILPSV